MVKQHLTLAALVVWLCFPAGAIAQLRVGAAKVDVTPERMPVLVNGSMTSRTVDQVTTRIYARAIVLDSGGQRVGICVVDSCMLPKHLCDEAKQLAATRTKIAPDRMSISSTHTHSAPSSMGALGTDADPSYVPFVRQKLAEAFVQAESKLQPARVGWGTANADDFTALRRWVLRPDRVREDPFGNPTVRATMHAARTPDDAIGPTGPEDPELALIAFESEAGQPLAVLCNFSMHYFGGQAGISADYFGYFCEQLEQRLDPSREHETLAIMSHGCSGDIWRRDYMRPREIAEGGMSEYALGLLEVAEQAYDSVEFSQDTTLEMEQRVLPMRYRVPNAQRLAWAQSVVAEMGDRLPKTQPEIYAREQLFLHDRQTTEIIVQAIRIGDIAIATTPNETYALTGLKLKLQSPLEKTMVIELANGGDGYIPPPEQHFLGGYNTWAARSAGLEETAEPRIVAQNLVLLEQVCRLPKRKFEQSQGDKVTSILDSEPMAFWRCDEFAPPLAADLVSGRVIANYEPGVVFFLEGPGGFTTPDETNRCAHFAGGRMLTQLPALDSEMSVVLSIWNGMPPGVRDVTGWFMSNDQLHAVSPSGMHLGLDKSGALLLQVGNEQVTGRTPIARWEWQQVALVRSNSAVRVWLAGQDEPEIELEWERDVPPNPEWTFGGRSDNRDNWEGKLDEIAIYDRAMQPAEIARVLAKTPTNEQ